MSAAMTPGDVQAQETPLTDEREFDATYADDKGNVVPADFARSLERSLATAKRECEELRKDAEWAREFKRTQQDASREGWLLISLRMTKGGQYHESRHVLTERDLNGQEATNGQVVAMMAKLTFGKLMHHIDAASEREAGR